LETVAEYVETGEIAKILMGMDVGCMQGYYFGKPENHRSWLNEGEYRSE
jgi:EAL domain-containing protein (putative c-di-GMP-specific phosphodiesterase class I)